MPYFARNTDHAMQTCVQEPRILPRNRLKVRDMVNAIEQRMKVSKIKGAASAKARALGQDLKPSPKEKTAALKSGLERTAHTAQPIKEKRIMQAHEKARRRIRRAAPAAAVIAALSRTVDVPVTKSGDDTDKGVTGSGVPKELVVDDAVTALSNIKHCETLPNQKDAKARGQDVAIEGEVVSKEVASVAVPTEEDRLDESTEQGDAEAVGQETTDVVDIDMGASRETGSELLTLAAMPLVESH